MPLVSGLMLLGTIALSIFVFEVLGMKFLALKSFFASFTLLWYWATVENAQFNKLPHSLLGALVGVGLAWQMQLSLAHFGGTNGLIIGLVPIIIALFIVIMNWVPIAINGSAMLFLTVLGAPAFAAVKLNFAELIEAIILGAIYFAIVVWLAHQYVNWRNRVNAAKAGASGRAAAASA
jgi:hypothetical protein